MLTQAFEDQISIPKRLFANVPIKYVDNVANNVIAMVSIAFLFILVPETTATNVEARANINIVSAIERNIA
ncbi:MAG: hypothetical protein QXH64_01040 [Nitrososphaeria archaeon]